MKIDAEDIEPGHVIITSDGRRCTVKTVWCINDIVTVFCTDDSETDYDWDELIEVEDANS